MAHEVTVPQKWLPSAALGVSVTPAGSAWGNSAWVQISASMSLASTLAALNVNAAAGGVPSDFEVDIGVGGAGSEQVIATYRGRIESLIGASLIVFPTPIKDKIPASSRVAVRMRKTGTDTTAWRFAIGYYESYNSDLWTENKLEVSHPAAAGASVTPNGTAWVNSNYSQIVASVPYDINIGQLVITAAEAQSWEIDIATGGAGSETVISTYAGKVESIAGQSVYTLPVPLRVSSGSRIAVRMRKAGITTTAWTVAMNWQKAVEPVLNLKTLSASSAPTATMTADKIRVAILSAASTAVGTLSKIFKAFAGPVYGGSSVLAPDFTVSSTQTMAYDVGSGDNRLLVVGYIANSTSPTVSSMSYNGVALSLARRANQQGNVEIWYLHNPAAGSNTLSVTLSGTISTANVIPMHYTNALQESPGVFDQSAQSQGSGNSRTASVTPLYTDEVIIGFLRHSLAGEAVNPGTGVTERHDQNGDDSANRIAVGERRALGLVSTALAFNWTNSAGDVSMAIASFRGISTQTFTQALDAVATGVASLTLARITNLILSATGTAALSLLRVVQRYRTLNATSTPSATMTRVKQYYRTLAASSAVAATMTRVVQRYRTLSATATSAPSLIRVALYARTLSAVSTGVATMARARVTVKTLSAVGTGVATLTRMTSKTLNAVTTPAATMTRVRQAYRTLSATAIGVATMAKGFVFSRTLSATGISVATMTRIRTVVKTLSASTAPSATLVRVRQAYRTLAATAISVATMTRVRQAYRTLNATAISVPTIVRLIGKTLSAVSPAIATMVAQKLLVRILSATSTPVATLTRVRTALRTLSATAIGLATLQRMSLFYRSLSVTTTPVATMTRVRQAYKTLSAVVTSVATLTGARLYFRTLNASSAPTASLTRIKNIYRTLSATGIGVATMTRVRSAYRTLSVVTTPVASLSRLAERYRTLSAVAISVPTITRAKQYYRTLTASATAVATLTRVRNMYRVLSAVATGNASLSRTVSHYITLGVVAPFVATMSRARFIVVTLNATAVGVATLLVNIIGATIKRFTKVIITMGRNIVPIMIRSANALTITMHKPKQTVTAQPEPIAATVTKPIKLTIKMRRYRIIVKLKGEDV